jgi:transcriptional regulator with XRE-family HTH domain
MQQVVSRQDRLAELVASLHERSGASLRAFARDLGVSHTAVGSWMKGKGNLDESSLEAIAHAAGSTRDQLKLYLDGNIDLKEYLEGNTIVVPLPLVEQSLKGYSPQELSRLIQMCATAIAARVESSDASKSGRLTMNEWDDDRDFLPIPSPRAARKLKHLVEEEGRRRGWGEADFVSAGVDPKLYRVLVDEDWVQAQLQRRPAKHLVASLAVLLHKVERWEGDRPVSMNNDFCYRDALELWTELERTTNGNLLIH